MTKRWWHFLTNRAFSDQEVVTPGHLGQADLYPSLVSGPYIQHNPLFPNGLDAIVGYIKQARAHTLRGQTRRHRPRPGLCTRALLGLGGQETAGVDIFRFDADGKVVDHWDVLQPVPASSNNANTMFQGKETSL